MHKSGGQKRSCKLQKNKGCGWKYLAGFVKTIGQVEHFKKKEGRVKKVANMGRGCCQKYT